MTTTTAAKPFRPYTRDRGPFRILIEGNADGRNQYFEVTYGSDRPGEFGVMRREIVFVRDSRIAFNNAIRRHGRRLLNIVNLETGRLVVGSRF